MSTTNKTKNRIMLVGLVCLCTGFARAANPASPVGDRVVLTANDPTSVAIIDTPTGASVTVSVVTVPGDSPSSDPSLPSRTAASIEMPDGSVIHVNLVEVGQRVINATIGKRPRQFIEWVVNAERPFTDDAEAMAAQAGFDVHQSRLNQIPFGPKSVCWVTGQPVVEIPVVFNPNRIRGDNYRLEIIPPPSHDNGFGPIEGGDPGSDPVPPTFSDIPRVRHAIEGHDDGDLNGSMPPPGGDPGGSPTQPE